MTQEEFGQYIRDTLDSRGIRYSHVASKLGMTRQNFNTRLQGRGWTVDEISKVLKILNLPSDILL